MKLEDELFQIMMVFNAQPGLFVEWANAGLYSAPSKDYSEHSVSLIAFSCLSAHFHEHTFAGVPTRPTQVFSGCSCFCWPFLSPSSFP